jgi:dTDP-4-dehydrorhamnose reductase
MKYLIIGASGYIGSKLFKAGCSNTNVIGTSTQGDGVLMPLNIENINYGVLECINSETNVILAAAISSPDSCKNRSSHARSVNIVGSCNIIEYALNRGARVLFLSSDTVYGEQPNQFDEKQTVNPSGEYANMKHQVEVRFKAHDSFKSIRLSYVFSRFDKFTTYLQNSCRTNTVAEIYHPFCRSVIHINDVTQGVFGLFEKWGEIKDSQVNFGGASCVSRIDMVIHLTKTRMLSKLKFVSVIPGDDFFSDRPKTINMLSPNLKKILGRDPMTFYDAAELEFENL